jgi:ABC-type branched-subunit amino acid transport system substrate-binding protein
MKKRIEIGILYSQSGDYQLLSKASRDGVMEAIECVNSDPARSIVFVPHERDPEGRIERYGALCNELLREGQVQHIFGCTTSWSRKEVIPVLERHQSLLWYACPYEGFEANDHVVYTHACPNQHIVPLLAYVVPRFGKRAFLAGSNYVWGWEVNRVARDLVGEMRGRVLGERYLPIGDVDVGRLIEEIRTLRPSFILNNLIGQSSYAFLNAYAELGRQDPAFLAHKCPVVSCNLTEPELPAIGAAAEGLLSVGPYFAEPGTGRGAGASSFPAAAHAAVTMLADAIEAAGTAEPTQVRQVLPNLRFGTLLGDIRIDAQTQHTSLPVRIASVVDGAFRTVWESASTRAPDPYLSHHIPGALDGRPHLRVVS